MGLVKDGEPYYCAHCEFEYPADWYIAHMPDCIAWHKHVWPIHTVDHMSGCPMLCGQTHMTEDEQDKLTEMLIRKINREEFAWSSKPLQTYMDSGALEGEDGLPKP